MRVQVDWVVQEFWYSAHRLLALSGMKIFCLGIFQHVQRGVGVVACCLSLIILLNFDLLTFFCLY